MTATVEQLKSQAKTLSAAERADLAYFLISSLDDEMDVGVEETWNTEIDRRVAEIESGIAVGEPIDKVLAELRELYP
jgi:putative addiction module component (TIGR02574 family)